MAEVVGGSQEGREEGMRMWGASQVADPPSSSAKFLRKITGTKIKSKTFRVAVLGQDGVGKTGMCSYETLL